MALDKLRVGKEHQTQTWRGQSGNAVGFFKPINTTAHLSVLTTLFFLSALLSF